MTGGSTTHVWVVLCNYEGGAYTFSVHASQEGALALADRCNQEAREVRAQSKKWRDNGYREEDEPDDLELEEHFYTVEGVEVEP